ncbi:hypothetical protein ASPVEDRAFT_89005 [Aspergillus versicolor CBS 583.65]|uniref:Dioxygenase n=1 Tax=Aspergillus versicolor CBS 583.65 TaxID=1036611 RepID=A0A1L9Q1Y4_ASPVE|nr:uncharacterized protein ASPVEDRAFT_89005 [Aspergillus versicolor CBS 583.65]OJJ07763.1 hypothetical protein ASPVEDRAFT_89005 [Aspergillus versicolor CBS 583.65]
MAEGFRTEFSPAEDRKYLPPYLQDTPETTTEVECPVQGYLPSWVHGSLVRVGCGQYIIPTSDDGSTKPVVLQHWFDGLNTLHKFRIENGKVHYMSRSTTKGVLERVKQIGKFDSPTIGASPNQTLGPIDPCSTRLGAQQSVFTQSSDEAFEAFLPPDAVNINITPRRGYALIIGTDFNMLQVCDAKSLEPKRLFTYAVIDEALQGAGICAHQGKDRKRGTQYNYVIDKTGTTYVFGIDTTSRPSKLLWKTPIFRGATYIHHIGVSQQYVVFVRQPIALDPTKSSTSMAEMWNIDQKGDTEFYLIDKDSGKHVATYRIPGFLYFHMANAYDFKDANGKVTVHVDICSYSTKHVPVFEYSMSNILDPLTAFSNGTLVRYELEDVYGTLDPTEIRRGTVRQSISCDLELPRIRKDRSSVPGYRYVWGASDLGGDSPGTQIPVGRLGNGVGVASRAFLGHLVKADWKTGKVVHLHPTDGDSCPCEPIFVERPGSTEEDDGVVLTIVCNRDGTKSVLVVLDGQTMKEIARADMPQVYGIGFHGTFIEAGR